MILAKVRDQVSLESVSRSVSIVLVLSLWVSVLLDLILSPEHHPRIHLVELVAALQVTVAVLTSEMVLLFNPVLKGAKEMRSNLASQVTGVLTEYVKDLDIEMSELDSRELNKSLDRIHAKLTNTPLSKVS